MYSSSTARADADSEGAAGGPPRAVLIQNDACAAFSDASRASHETSVAPSGTGEPGGGEHCTPTAPSTRSVALGAAYLAVGGSPGPNASVTLPAGESAGGVVSRTIRCIVAATELFDASVAVHRT